VRWGSLTTTMTDGDSALHGGTRAAVNDDSRRVVGSREREREVDERSQCWKREGSYNIREGTGEGEEVGLREPTPPSLWSPDGKRAHDVSGRGGPHALSGKTGKEKSISGARVLFVGSDRETEQARSLGYYHLTSAWPTPRCSMDSEADGKTPGTKPIPSETPAPSRLTQATHPRIYT
jgi:hypothetical protein